MKYATIEDLDAIMDIVKKYRKTVFPYFREDKLKEKIQRSEVMLDKQTFIIFGTYRKRTWLGEVCAHKGDMAIHEIGTEEQGSGCAHDVLAEFIDNFSGKKIWLTVRKENERAVRFYIKHEFEIVGGILWSDGKLPGCVMMRSPK